MEAEGRNYASGRRGRINGVITDPARLCASPWQAVAVMPPKITDSEAEHSRTGRPWIEN